MEEYVLYAGAGDGRSGSQNQEMADEIGEEAEVCGGKEPFESLIRLRK